MNAEWISDALNDLDEDLIAQTDEVRRGVRVLYRPPVRRIIAAAACVVLVLVGVRMIPPVAEKSDAMIDNMMEMSNAGASGMPEYGYEPSDEQWQMVNAGALTVFIPPGWEWAKMDTDDEWGDHIALSCGDNHFIIGYSPGFAVCGTGLKEETAIISGMEARVGTYDGKSMWDFIVFENDYVVINHSGENWSMEEWDTIRSILETLTIEKEDAQ